MAPTFIAVPNARLPFRSLIRPKLCTARRNALIVSPSALSSAMQKPQMNTAPNESDDMLEDDDASMGAAQPTRLGMQVPGLTREEREYLDAASSDVDLRQRISFIANQKEAKREEEKKKRGIESADSYIEHLSRSRPKTQDTSAYVEKDFHKNPSDDYIHSLSAQRAQQAQPVEVEPLEPVEASVPEPVEASVPEPVEASVPEPAEDSVQQPEVEEGHDEEDVGAQIAELEAQLKEAAAELESDSTAANNRSAPSEAIPQEGVSPVESSAASSTDAGTVDKQIEFLEAYLEKLQREQDEEKKEESDEEKEETANRFDQAMETLQNYVSTPFEEMEDAEDSAPEIEGLDDAPGEMSAEDKKKFFMMIREQARTGTQESPYADPLAVPLPSKRELVEESDEDVYEGEDSYESVVEEIEAEIGNYLENMKAQVVRHEIRVKQLLTKLREMM